MVVTDPFGVVVDVASFDARSVDTIVRACAWYESVGGLPVTAQALRWYTNWLIDRSGSGDLIIVDELAAELREHLHEPFVTGEA